LGGRVRACFSGGAGVPEHVRGLFEEQGLPVLEGYGLSEASPVVSATPRDAYRPGSVGRPIAGAEVRIAEDGEILTRGPHVMLGYWQDEAATRAALQDGWLHTGDLGRLDRDGYLHVTGRKKEIIVTAAGKKVDPAHLEQLLRQSPFILQAMVVGEGRNYLAALIVPDPEALRAEIRRRRLFVLSRRGALRHRAVRELYRQEIKRLLAGVSRHEQIGRFALLDRGFTPESGELTPKASLRRDAIAVNHARLIERMYGR
jgi:long-chain acyl-CoA synthetase